MCRAPALGGEFLEGTHELQCGTVNDDRGIAETGPHLVGIGTHLFPVRDVDPEGRGLAARPACDIDGFRGIGEVGNGDARALASQTLHDRLADARGAAGDGDDSARVPG
jgi:hypothetical protein